MRSSLALALLLAFSAAAPSLATAQGTAAQEQAARLFQMGQQAFDNGDFDEAAISFQEAFNLDPHPVLLFNLARAHEEMGDLPGALSFFRRVHQMNPSPAVRQAADDKISEIEASLVEQGYDPRTVTTRDFVPRGGLVVETEPSGARVFINGDFSGLTPFEVSRLDAGPLELRLTLEDHLPVAETIEISGGQTTFRRHNMPPRTSLTDYTPPEPALVTIRTPQRGVAVRVDGRRMGVTPAELTLAPGRYEITLETPEGDTWSETITLFPGQAIDIDAPLVRSLSERREQASNIAAWALVGTGGALLAGGAVVGLLAAGDVSRYNDQTDNPDRGNFRDGARSKAITADVLLATGTATAAAGGILLFMRTRGAERERPDDSTDRLVLLPWAAPGGAGVTVRQRF